MPIENAIAACLEAEYSASPGAATSPASETTLITWPRPAGRISSSAAIVPLNVPSALTSITFRRVSASCSQVTPVTQHARVVDPDVERAAALGDRGCGGRAGLGVAHVEHRRPGAAPDAVGRGRHGRLVDVGQADAQTAVGEHARDLEPEAARGARDECSSHGARA